MKINYVTQRGNQNPTNEFNVVEEDPSYAFDGKINYITQRGNQNPTNQFNVVEEDPSSSFDAENNESTSQFDMEFSNIKGKKKKKTKKKKKRIGGGLFANFKKNQAIRQKRRDEQAKSQTVAARQLGKTDPADLALAKALQTSSEPVEIPKPKSKTMLYVGISAAILLVAVGGFFAYKKFSKK
jgi:hypothetical protein